MGLLSWLIVGGLAGFIASKLMKGYGSGVVMNIIIGIVGAFLGGVVMNLVGQVGVVDFSLRSILVSIVGSVILLAIVGAFTKKR